MRVFADDETNVFAGDPRKHDSNPTSLQKAEEEVEVVVEEEEEKTVDRSGTERLMWIEKEYPTWMPSRPTHCLGVQRPS